MSGILLDTKDYLLADLRIEFSGGMCVALQLKGNVFLGYSLLNLTKEDNRAFVKVGCCFWSRLLCPERCYVCVFQSRIDYYSLGVCNAYIQIQ